MSFYPVPLPSDLPTLPRGWPVAVDCETGHLNKGGSGLWADSGARLSIVSVAWIPPAIVRHPDPEVLRHTIKTGEGVQTRAFPFAQGIWYGPHEADLKPGQQPDLFSTQLDNPNLGPVDWATLNAWLRLGHRLVFQNGKFDLEKLRCEPLGWSPEHAPGTDLLESTYWDTQVVAPIFWPRETTSLKPTAARLWGEDETAEVDALKLYLGPKTDPAYDLVPWDVIGPYAAKDTNLTIRLAYHQWAMLGRWWGDRDQQAIDQAEREFKVMRILYRMERAGIPYDAAASMEAAAMLGSQIAAVDRRLPFRPTDAQAKQFFFSERPVAKEGKTTAGLGLLPYSTTEKGNPQLTAEVVQRLVKDYPETEPAGAAARLWAHRAKLDTAVSMWYLPYAQGIGSDGRLRTCFRQVTRGRGTEDGGTRSGRLSVERVNLQAIPHDYRLSAADWGVPTPRELIGMAASQIPGYELWEFDLAQAELRVAAAWAKCGKMLSAIRHGRDMHGETTMELWPGMTKESSEWGFYRQLGKRANFAQPYDEPVLTPSGWSTMGELQPGSELVSADGSTQTVQAVPFDGECEVWQVHTEDGRLVRCSENHLWATRDRNGTHRVETTAQLAAALNDGLTRTLPMWQPQGNESDVSLPVDPYILGVLLGDGSWRTTPYFTILTSDEPIAAEVERRLPPGDTLVRTVYAKRPNMTRYSIHGGGVLQGLRDLQLLLGYKRPVTGARKFVPAVYFESSWQQRVDLLRGLMDTDGSASKSGHVGSKGKVGATYRFASASKALADAVARLAWSLGGRGTVRPNAAHYVTSVSTPVCPFGLGRKAERWAPMRRTRLAITAAAPTGQHTRQRCILVSNPDSLYVTRDYVVTHNTLCFGAGGETFGRMISKETGVILSSDESSTIVSKWNGIYPEFRRAIERWSRYVEEHRQVPLASRDGFATGRPRVFRRDEDDHKAFNQIVQGSLAEFLKDWMIEVQGICDEEGLGYVDGVGYTGLLLSIHDSIVALLPEGEREEQIAARIVGAAESLWEGFFGREDSAGRVLPINGTAEGKRWG